MKTVLRLLCLSIACLGSGPTFAQIKVVTTLPDYGALVQVIGGPHVQVSVLASATEDPHYVDPKPSYILALNRAEFLVINGGELEIGWLPKLLVQARNSKIQNGQVGHLRVSSHIKNLLDVPVGKMDRSMGDVHGSGNPHFYYDPVRMNELLPMIAERLSRIDPDNKAQYLNNLKTAQAQFSAHIARWKSEISALPPEKRRVVAYHKSLDYLFQTLGVVAVSYLEPKPGVAPTPSHIAQVLGTMKREKTRAIVQEQYYPSSTSKTLTRLVSGQQVLITPGTKPGQTYLAHMDEVIGSIRQALEGTH